MKNTRIKIGIIILSISFIILGVYIVLAGIIFPKRYKGTIEKAANIYTIDPNLVYAVIKQESNFYKAAISKSGAKGLMQVMESTAKEVASDIANINCENFDLYDPYTNIHIGTNYLSTLVDYFDGNYYLALAAYNAGMGRVSNWFHKPYNKYDNLEEVVQIIEYSETKTYLKKVINNYKWYVNLY